MTRPVIEVQTRYGSLLAFEDDFITRQIRKYGAHTRSEIAFLLSMVDQGDAVFDLGAHIGTYAIALAQKVGGTGRLLAVEAEPETFALLQRNLAVLRGGDDAPAMWAENLLIAPAGLRYVAEMPEGNTGGTTFLVDELRGSVMPTASLDELAAQRFAPRLIKMDIEGAEAAALANAQLLRDTRPIVYAEVNGKVLARHGRTIGEIERTLRDRGYRLFRNVAPRHAASDAFEAVELEALPTDLNNFDVMAVHTTDERLGRLTS